MISPRLLVGVVLWLARWKSQAEEFQKTVCTFLKHLCLVIPVDASFRWGANDIPISHRRLLGALVAGLLHAAGILVSWHTGKVFKRPRLDDGGEVPLYLVMWTVFRESKETPEALELCQALVELLVSSLDAMAPSQFHDTFPVCRLRRG